MKFGVFDWVEAGADGAAEVYEHKLRLAEAADAAGFHAMYLAEHQGTPLSIDGSPSVLLSALIQRTRRLRVGALTFCLPWYNPYRFYNEVCMLDQLSRGRLELGVGRGVSPIESAIFGLQSLEESRERYRETLDVFFAACRNDSLNHQGKYYRYRDIELHLKPYQRPYPPLWFPSSNRDSIEFTARHGYSTVLNTPAAEAKVLFEKYREIHRQHLQDPERHNAHVAEPFLAKTHHIVVADTDAQGERLGRSAYEAWAERVHHLTRKQGRPDVFKLEPAGEGSVMRLAAGAPRTVLRQLEDAVRETGMNYLMCIFSFGDLPPRAALRSLELFAREVMPIMIAPKEA